MTFSRAWHRVNVFAPSSDWLVTAFLWINCELPFQGNEIIQRLQSELRSYKSKVRTLYGVEIFHQWFNFAVSFWSVEPPCV